MKLFVVLCFLILFASVSFSDPVIKIDPTVKYQTITGWEATAQAGQDFASFPLYKDVLFDRAVNELGINRLRVGLVSSMENPVDFFGTSGEVHHDIVNDNSDPFRINPKGFHFTILDHNIDTVVLPIAKRLKARGEKLFLNITYEDFGTDGFEHRKHPEEYAEFVLATYLHLKKKYRMVPDTWEVILEPDNASWSPEEIGACVIAAGERLAKYGFTPRFIAPSASNMMVSLSFFERLIRFPGISTYLQEFSYHRYGGVSNKVLRSIASKGKAHQIDTSMLEHINSGYEDLHRDLKMGNVSSWQQYTLAFPGTQVSGGEYYLLDLSNAQIPVILTPSKTKFLRQYFHYIRRGALRIGASTASERFNPVAFINKNKKYVVIVKASKGGTFTVTGLPAGSYGIKYTTSTQAGVSHPDVQSNTGKIHTSIPAKGVITIYQK